MLNKAMLYLTSKVSLELAVGCGLKTKCCKESLCNPSWADVTAVSLARADTLSGVLNSEVAHPEMYAKLHSKSGV